MKIELTDQQIARAIGEWVKNANINEIVRVVGNMFGGHLYPEDSSHYSFYPNDDYRGAFDDIAEKQGLFKKNIYKICCECGEKFDAPEIISFRGDIYCKGCFKWLRNYYNCPSCSIEWINEWNSMVDDRCPKCEKEIEPYKSHEVTEKEEV